MKILKKILCICCALTLILCFAGCDKEKDGTSSGDGNNEPMSAFNAQADKFSEVFFEAVPENASTSYSNDESIDGVECYVYEVMSGLEKVGTVAIDQNSETNVFISEDGETYNKAKVSLDELPSSEVKNIKGDRMVLNVVDNSLYIYDVQGSYGVLFQIIKLGDDKEYTNDTVSATNFNFDDYTDISVLKSDMGMVTSYSDYYLFDDGENKFIKNEALSEIPNLGVDGGSGTLSSYTRISASDNETVTYSWVDGKLVPIGKKVQKYNADENLFYITEYEYDEDLNEVEVSSESYTQEELDELYS